MFHCMDIPHFVYLFIGSWMLGWFHLLVITIMLVQTQVCKYIETLILIFLDIYLDVQVYVLGFPGGSAGKESSCSMGDLGSIPGLGRFPWRREQLFPPVFWPKELHGLYSIVHGVAKSQTWLSKFHSPRCRIAGPWKWKSLNRVWLFGTPWIIQSMDSPGQNTGVGSLSLLQGISPTQGSNRSLLHCRWISLPAEPQGKPRNTGVGSLSLLQQIFLTQESNWGLLNCRRIFLPTELSGKPYGRSMFNFLRPLCTVFHNN